MGWRAALLVTASAITLAAAIGRLADRPGTPVERWEPVLIAAAGLCLAGLTIRRSPWGSAVAGAIAVVLSGIDVLARVRSELEVLAPTAWAPFVAIAAACAGVAALACSLVLWHAAADLRAAPLRASIRGAGGLGLSAVVVSQAVALLMSAGGSVGPPVDSLAAVRGANRLMILVTAAELVAVAALVAGPRVRRAWRRRRGPDQRPSTDPSGSGFLTALAEEFVPGLVARNQAAAAAERVRLAADLHARVLPDLRRVVETTPGGNAAIVDNLRSTLADVETLIVDRHPLIVDELGLVAGLEWLAERTEERAGATVTLELEGSDSGKGPAASAEPPVEVSRAAFRIAMLAIDNAVRHAPGSPVSLRLISHRGRLSLEIADRGPGLDASAVAAARHSGHRGLIDIEAAAAAVHGSVALSSDPDRGGTAVTFRWNGGR